jgi:hypothetical protein
MRNVHFVGSVALDTVEEVFAAIGEHCGPYLKRIPDGEPGGRRLWISWQIPVLRANPSLAPVGRELYPLKLADGVSPAQIHFGELGYAREARTSYQDFLTARESGQIPAGVRFQVSLPTPWAVVMPFCQQPDAQQIYPRLRAGDAARGRAESPGRSRITISPFNGTCASRWFSGTAACRRDPIFLGWTRCSPPTLRDSARLSQAMSSSDFISATATSTPGTSSNRSTHGRWWSSRTSSSPASHARSPGSTCRFRSIGLTMRSMRR